MWIFLKKEHKLINISLINVFIIKLNRIYSKVELLFNKYLTLFFIHMIFYKKKRYLKKEKPSYNQ